MKRQTCLSCDRSLPTSAFPKLPRGSGCSHGRGTCRRCWQQWLAAQVTSQPSDQISCAQCSNILGESEIKALATSTTYHRFLDAELKRALSTDPDFRWCMGEECGSGQLHTGGDTFRCATCGHKACVSCNVPWHDGETCGGFQSRQQRKVEDEIRSERELKLRAKECPGCESKVAKVSGCDLMTCSRCRHEYCWLCLVDYREVRAEGNSAHERDCAHWRAPPVPDASHDIAGDNSD